MGVTPDKLLGTELLHKHKDEDISDFTVLDTRYLLLDATNSPITGDLVFGDDVDIVTGDNTFIGQGANAGFSVGSGDTNTDINFRSPRTLAYSGLLDAPGQTILAEWYNGEPSSANRVLTIDSTGNFAAGTNGGVYSRNNINETGLGFSNTQAELIAESNLSFGINSLGALTLRTFSWYTQRANFSGGTTLMRLTDDAKLSIGGNFSGETSLHIRDANGAIFTIQRFDTTVTSSDSMGKINFTGNDSQLTTQTVFGDIEVQSAQTVTTDAAAGRMIFRTTSTAVGGAPLEAMRIGPAQNIGVGLSSDPSAKLHIDQNSTTAALPVLILDQADVSEEAVRFVGSAASATLTQTFVSSSDVSTFTPTGYLKINIQDDGNQITDGAYYLQFGTLT